MRNREVQLADGSNFVYEVENRLHRSSCTETYLQCSLQSTQSNMVLELFVQIITEPCFNILRTKEQLGYIVFSGIRRSNGVQGLRIIVQSDRHPAYVDQRVEAFLANMGEHIRQISDEEFERHREALAAQRLEKPKRLASLSARFWSEIISQQYNFDRANIEVAYLRTVTKEDIVRFYDDLISSRSPGRHKLAVHVVSMAEGGAGAEKNPLNSGSNSDEVEVLVPEPTKIEDITQFKSSQSLFPLVQPYINISPPTKSKL